MAFPAPPGVDEDADDVAAEGVRLGGVDDGDLEPELPAGSDVDTSARDRVDDDGNDGNDIDDEDVLTDAAGDGQL